ncbi:MAG: winged helix DNA-binding domain-containing protein [Chloroflexi bacterium]|nr:winged helix DNA-binding domain-containing protein [Chloroflexota bacterium]
MALSLSRQEAKRIAIRSQGLANGSTRLRSLNRSGETSTAVTIDEVGNSIRAMGLLQIDSVNVCVRSHYMPLFSRLGSYDQELLDQLAYREKSIFETWAHAACFVPVEDHRLFRQRMASHTTRRQVEIIESEKPGYLEDVLEQIRNRGALTASELDGAGKRNGPWWGYTTGKIVAEHHFANGNLSVADRRNFARYYDLTERVVPAEHLNGSTPSVEESNRELMRRAVTAQGVGVAADFGDYYHVKNANARARLNELVEEGVIRRAKVEGWPTGIDAYTTNETVSTGATDARALLTPFDPLVWNRDRIERVFDFFYRIEIYVPEKLRQYGYYVYPFLLGEDLVARVDLKAERDKGVLRVKGAFVEPGHDREYVASNLADELRLMAEWLGLRRVGTGRKGNLMPALRAALK